MGCCLFASMLAGAPRLALLIWWIADPHRFSMAFHSFVGPLLGIVFLPWTTIMYVAVYQGGVHGLDWLWIALGLVVDFGVYASNARAREARKYGDGSGATTV